ncbi:GNAT family N-acetyltransferase [Bacteroidota bacterium]
MEIILSEKYKLRPWLEEDATALAIHANNKKIALNLRDGFPFPYTVEEAKKWLNMAIELNTAIYFAIDQNGEAIGSIGISPFQNVYRNTAEIGYWLSEKYWKQGITSMAVKAMVKFGFENYELQRIQAGIYENNLPSMNVLKKCGFHLEAIHKKAVIKDGKIMDEHLYVILKNEYLKNKSFYE